jgi:hypothetical protein
MGYWLLAIGWQESRAAFAISLTFAPRPGFIPVPIANSQ